MTSLTEPQQRRLQELIDAERSDPSTTWVGYWCSNAQGRSAFGHGGTLTAYPGTIQEADGPLAICDAGGLHATRTPHRWPGVRVFIVALLGPRIDQADKSAASRREVVAEVFPEDCLEASIAAKVGRKDLYEADLSRANLSRADLSRADLSRANLYGADLSGAYLSRANLSGANLYGANLSRANLYRANLYRANLYGADLSGANLYGADLTRANLSGAYLSGANLSGANLSGADLSRANLYGADLSGANLSRANLSRANLYRANLYRANRSENPPPGWRIANGILVRE